MAKQLAMSTQLKNALARIAQLEKELKSANDSKDRWYKEHTEVSAVIEQIHQVLDAVPGSIPRESEGENSWDRIKRSPITRMAAWLSSRP
ncbi:MAG: hypothetical protein KGI71_04270 [Patescibacteria group bacterium]|nr:hypothetical protein [Patescibacteria group bacterium]